MLEHWAYPALISILIPISLGLTQAWESKTLWKQYAAGAFYGTFLIFLALLVHLNVRLRGTDEKMYRWALFFTTSNPIHYNLGVHLLDTGRAKEAIPYFARVCETYPNNPDHPHALAVAYGKAGYYGAACKILRHLRATHPDYHPAIQSLKTAETALKEQKK